jgi:signal transduction histidine kinase
MHRFAHDVRHELAEIQACAEMHSRHHGDSEFLQNITRAVARIDAIIDALSPRPSDAMRGRVDRDVNQMIREIAAMSIFAIVRVVTELDPALPSLPLTASPTDLTRIITNLCGNAKHAMLAASRAGALVYDSSGETGLPASFDPLPQEIGTIRITTRKVVGGMQPSAATLIEIKISDTGPGLSVDGLARLERRMNGGPESIEAGHGNGLQIVRQLTANLHGQLAIESSEGKGTTFTLLLPA